MSFASITKTTTGISTASPIPANGHGRRFARRKALMQAALAEVIDAGEQSGAFVQGAHVSALERQVALSWQVPAALAVNSGTAALRLALEALHLEAGREVILPALTFIATAYAVSDAHLVPVFVDIDPETFTLDPEAVRAALTDKTAAIIPVHLYGQMADMTPLVDIATTYDLYLLEDAAQAHGATYLHNEKVCYAGSLGDLGCFSLNGIKNMGALGDGGLITISGRMLAQFPQVVEQVRGLRDLGRVGSQRYTHDAWGWRARMDECTALECLLELAEVAHWNQQRRVIAARYDAALAGTPFQAPKVAVGREAVYVAYAVCAPSVKQRTAFERSLRAAGVEVAAPSTLVPAQRLYWTGVLPCRIESLPVARDVAQRITHLPLYPELEEEEIERIITALLNWT
jgi:dTDP-4-amino-4,6-dideoxygalactose transaminase